MDLIKLSQRNPRIKNIRLFSILTSYACVFGALYSSCYEYETYCLFSFGPNVNVNNVKEAQKICENAKHGSWLLEIVDDRTLKNVEEFLSKYSFPEDTKLILNAGKVRSKCGWTTNTSNNHSIICFLSSDDDGVAQIYQLSENSRNDKNRQFAFICSIGCHSNITTHERKRYDSILTFHVSLSKFQCLELCEQSKCEAWEWKSDVDINGCWIQKVISGNMTDGIGTLFVIDKSVKIPETCIGNVKEPNITDPGSRLTEFVITLFIAIVMCFCFGLLLRKRHRQRSQHDINNFSTSCNNEQSRDMDAGYTSNQSHIYTSLHVYGSFLIYSEVILWFKTVKLLYRSHESHLLLLATLNS